MEGLLDVAMNDKVGDLFEGTSERILYGALDGEFNGIID